MNPITKNESFFVEGTGKAIVVGETGKVGYIHLQNATFEFSSKMEDIFGGESNTSLFSYQTEKSGSVTFTNASMDTQTVALTQGVKAKDKGVVVFALDEAITVGADGVIKLAHADTADLATLVVADDEGNVVKVTDSKVDTTYAGKELKATYAYTTDTGAVGLDVQTVSVPGYATIYFKSKPMKQKNGRIVRMNVILYKTRSDGSLKLNFKHKNAFAPELKFSIVDPERKDGKFWSFATEDVTEAESDNKDVTAPTGSAGSSSTSSTGADAGAGH